MRFCNFFLVILLLLSISSSKGDHAEPTIEVQINEQTDLFERSIDDYAGLNKAIEGQQATTINGVENNEGLDFVTDQSEEQIKASVTGLSDIKAIDLNDRGSEEMAKENVLNELYVDYSKPLNKEHLIDAKKLGDGQDELMANLLGKLREIGVDCKTAKGPKEMEPTYYLQVKQTSNKDTKYNKKLCEELRNKYSCTDSVSLKCIRKGMKWEAWQRKAIEIGGAELVAQAKWIFRGEKLKKKHFRLFIKNGEAGVKGYFQNLIAAKKGVSIEQISTINLSVEYLDHYVNPYRLAWGGVDCPGLGRKEWIYPTYRMGYDFRDGHEICEEWSEDWTERCKQQ